MHDEFAEAAKWLRRAERLLVFTGAGISAESGIPTFRDAGGLWQEFPPERFANLPRLLKIAVGEPRAFARFVHAVVAPIAAAKPNAAHRAIAAAERYTKVTVVTQNIDALHQEAGSTRVHEVHGSLFEIVGADGQWRRLLTREQLAEIARRVERAANGRVPLPRVLAALRPLFGIGARGIYRPNVVLFGEAMAEPAWTEALRAAEAADCVLQVGCSREVYPAAMLPEEARARGAMVIGVDPAAGDGDVWLKGPAAMIVPQLFKAAFAADNK